MMLRPPDFEWDPVKRERNLTKHGIDFIDASRVFERVVVEWQDRRTGFGETRWIAVGPVDGRMLTVVYTWRGLTRRIISARRSRVNEEEAYAKVHEASQEQD